MNFPSEVPSIQWGEPPTRELALQTGEVHVWMAETDRDADFCQDPRTLLSAEELERAHRFHFEKDRRRFSRCRIALRQIAGAYLRKAPRELEFSYQEKGKPELLLPSGSLPLHFNLSHSEGIALFAFDLAHPLGVDVESINQRTDIESIAERYFSPKEIADWPEEEALRRQGFFTLWALKEAYLKARGSGLSFSLNAFEIGQEKDPGKFSLHVPQDPEQNTHWSLFGFIPETGYLAGLATDKSISNKYFFKAGRLPFN